MVCEQLALIKSKITEKNGKAFISGDPNPIKGLDDAVKYCKKTTLNMMWCQSVIMKHFITSLAQYEKFVFFPKTLETFVVLFSKQECLVANSQPII